jgi:arginase
MAQSKTIQIISAPSILGLKPGGVEKLPESLLANDLLEKLNCEKPVLSIPSLNSQYSFERDTETNCLNAGSIRDFSLALNDEVTKSLEHSNFSLVLGGDCSILIGIMPALKQNGNYGLIYCDAHADFYQPEKSVTGEVADMNLAILTGRGPDILTDINQQQPYVSDEHVIHIGQRDGEETRKYGSQDIKNTGIKCFDLEYIINAGLADTMPKIFREMSAMDVKGFWIHFDTDVLADKENPAVDYRLPDGLSFVECGFLLEDLLATNRIVGMSVTIFNPDLDNDEGKIAQQLTQLISDSFVK